MAWSYLALSCFLLSGVASGAVEDEHETCVGEACASIPSWTKSEDGFQGLEMLQMKTAAKTKAKSEQAVDPENQDENLRRKWREILKQNLLKIKEDKEATEQQNDVAVEEENTEDTKSEVSKPKCRWCKHSSYSSKKVSFKCKYPGSDGFQVTVKTEAYVKSYGTWNAWVAPHSLKKLYCRPYGRRGADALKSAVGGYYTEKKPDAVSKKMSYKDRNARKWNICNCAPCGKCGPNKDLFLKLILKSGKFTCDNEETGNEECEEEEETSSSETSGKKKTASSSSECVGGWTKADGIGESEKNLGVASSRDDCIKMVKEKCPTANALTMSPSTKKCYCEFGQYKTKSSSKYENCALPSPDACVGGWTKADGIGKSEKNLGVASSRDDCIKMVKDKCPDANGLTISPSTKKCYCEFGQYKTKSSSKYENCALPDACVGGWKKADGIGRSEKKVGIASSRDDCIKMVKDKCPDANGLTMSPSTKACYCEFAQYETKSSSKYENCALPSKDTCIGGWKKGDGNGKTEKHIGTASSDADCMKKVKEQCPTANGATMSTSSRKCYCEFGQTTPTSSSKYVNCDLR